MWWFSFLSPFNTRWFGPELGSDSQPLTPCPSSRCEEPQASASNLLGRDFDCPGVVLNGSEDAPEVTVSILPAFAMYTAVVTERRATHSPASFQKQKEKQRRLLVPAGWRPCTTICWGSEQLSRSASVKHKLDGFR